MQNIRMYIRFYILVLCMLFTVVEYLKTNIFFKVQLHLVYAEIRFLKQIGLLNRQWATWTLLCKRHSALDGLFWKKSGSWFVNMSASWFDIVRTAVGCSLPASRRIGGCPSRYGDRIRAGCMCVVDGSSTRPLPAALRTHEAPADEAPSCQSEAESGRRRRACTGASASPGRGRLWLTLARTWASPPGCWAPMSSSRFTGTSSPVHCGIAVG